jgi:Domain of unknown function (DUF4136)
MKTRLCLILMFAGWVTTGCQSMRVQTHYDQQIAFAGFHTFCWVPAPSWLHNDPRLHMDFIEPIVQRDVEAQLQARGFQSADCAVADFQVTFTAGINESLDEVPGPERSGVAVYQYSPGDRGEWFAASSGMKVTERRVPSLVILIREPRTDRVMWRGMASGNLPAPANDAQRQQRIQTAVRLILEKFPPPVSK